MKFTTDSNSGIFNPNLGIPDCLRSAIQSRAFSACLLLAISGSASAAQSDDALLAACNAGAFQTVLHAVPAAATAQTAPPSPQAVWLSRQLLQWPHAPAHGRYRLYHSASGQLQAQVGEGVAGSDGVVTLSLRSGKLPPAISSRFKYVQPGAVLSVPTADLPRMGALHRQQMLLVQEDGAARVLRSTAIQMAGALDDAYAAADKSSDLGVSVKRQHTQFKLWAPTAQAVSVCHFNTSTGDAVAAMPLRRDAATGNWSTRLPGKQIGTYYSYLVDVFVAGAGVVRNRVTDPYSISLNTDSQRSYIADLNDAQLKPTGWDRHAVPARVKVPVDMAVYELHVRDFSIGDLTVPEPQRGRYLAFTAPKSNGMRHLQALSKAGMTDVHLLPVFDIASVPEAGCTTPAIATTQPGDSEAPQAAVTAVAARDCFNWGYDPLHFNAPEGSYASDAADGAKRVIELRQMVMALHATGLRVGMDVVYNHTSASGQHAQSVLDRIVPGYYHRLNANGVVERSTCCDNTATENMMMGKLMIDSVELWAKQYRIDSFRFDLMAHQPRPVMEALQRRVNKTAGRHVNLIGEGWNFGEVANGARFVQASQLSLNGSGIGTFSDRGRDAVRGGSAGDNGDAQVRHQGYINGLVYDRNALSKATLQDLLRAADMVRVGLAGSIRNFEMLTHTGERKALAQIDYAGQPAGYASQPSEVVNYVENHDNQTLYDSNAFKLPVGTSTEDRARVQMLGVAITALSQGVAYFHAGIDVLRSKSMDRNSFDSGDWFNRLDWTYQTNYFGTGLPPKSDNGESWPLMQPLLANAALRPAPSDIAFARDVTRDLLAIRASTSLLRLRTTHDIRQRLTFPNSGLNQNPVVLVGHANGKGYAGANFKDLLYLINVDKVAHDITLPEEATKAYQLHPVQAASTGADARVRSGATADPSTGRFTVPARTTAVFVVR
jgi:pullulanase/glycogen debranching enzyme